METCQFLGIDAGSVAVSLVVIDNSGRIVGRGHAPHHGRVRRTLTTLVDGIDFTRIRGVAATSGTPDSIQRSLTVDPNVARIAAVSRVHGPVGSLLHVGGEKFSLVRFTEAGDYRDTRTNSSCAAGTGSFLDQQAKALGLEDGAALADAAEKAGGTPPRIASRCAVFAKTDLIHAQQEGYSREDICNGLCLGLANIVADTLVAGEPLLEPVLLSGGVALNRAVVRHLQARLGVPLLVDLDAHLLDALGAALVLRERAEESKVPETPCDSASDLVLAGDVEKQYFHEPLTLRLSDYPDFGSHRTYEYSPGAVRHGLPVEVDVYRETGAGEARVYLGMDIGSTSTKAVLLRDDLSVLAGFYTRTAGHPIEASQAILEAVQAFSADGRADLTFLGAGTTGSGRKLIGAVVGADLVVDEITAHARAAYELDPATDTIIEIGGQDAKFTTLRNGMVTSAVMNTVCAAGTGSFIEEQARRLECPLGDYSEAVEGVRAPLASDRCTVFMQRDINHLLANGYEVPEILATVLHSVRENYLQKVAREGSIGKNVCFQGATAKNRALVAAFEQRLRRPIRVSRYCHLTGALGVAHLLAEDGPSRSSFRGVSLYARRIPVRNEVCELCRNHCKIVAAEVMGETAAYGFLCGRDYDLERFVSGNTSGFDLLKTRRRILRTPRPEVPLRDVTVGLPAALYMFDDLAFWRRFFERLGLSVTTSEECDDPVGAGKRLAGAEFCAPMSAWHGHVDFLLESDVQWVFVPVYLDASRRERGVDRHYCYYSQFASPLTETLPDPARRRRLLRPLLTPGIGDIQTKLSLHASLKPVLGDSLSLIQVAQAFAEAAEHKEEKREELRAAMRREAEGLTDIAVVLLGRPYSCLAPRMNMGIPDILGTLGVKTFFQDMLTYDEDDVAPISPLLDQVHWHYAAKILEAAFVVAKTPGLYPVLVSTFKCAPDSFTIEFVRRILDEAEKPYLVLELDEHDSSVGYETRIEAAVRSFLNHLRRPAPTPRTQLPIVPEVLDNLDGRSVFLPNWDRLSCALVAANLRREGIDAHVLPEDELTIRRGLRRNTGQCIPLNAVVEGFVGEVRALDLEPARTALWMLSSNTACNIGMYPGYVKAMFDTRGGGFEKAAVYGGDIACTDISVRAGINTYFAYMFGGMLRRMACRVRPTEICEGETDAVLESGLATFSRMFESGGNKRKAVREVVDRFLAIETREEVRPTVAIFGDLYVRDNAVFNQDLVRFIERHGGEVITTPYSEYAKLVAPVYFQNWFHEGKILKLVVNGSLFVTARTLERQFITEFSRVLGPISTRWPRHSPQQILPAFGVTASHTGESMDNLLKVFHILESDPDVSLFVQANPAFCCPSLITEAMAGRIQEVTGVPVVTITYDGTAAARNDVIVPYLEFARRRIKETASSGSDVPKATAAR